LRAQYDLVVIEGAGSPVELNLQARDMVNMAVARYAQAPVLLVGDIDRGGIFAQLLGTLWLLTPAERVLVRGLVVNKFRGDLSLFTDGVRILEERSALPVLGVLPFLPDLYIPEEDAATLDEWRAGRSLQTPVVTDIAIIRLPHIANFDDFAPLAAEVGVGVRYVRSGATLGQPQAVILPGTKSTVADLLWLRAQGLEGAIKVLAATGTAIVGICGGYQMLGECIRDPQGVESPQPDMAGLGLLPVETVFVPTKATHQATARVLDGPAWLTAVHGQRLTGYEIHMGHTSSQRPWLELTRWRTPEVSLPDGAVDASGRVWGCYLHGLFANAAFRRAWLTSLGWHMPAAAVPAAVGLEAALDALAAQVETHLDMQLVETLLWDN
jgi:adenosylcobyric acid synthase